MEARREMTTQRVRTSGHVAFFLCAGLLAACASSGDVEQVRQERAQAKAKMSAELQQERKLAQSMEQESEARKAEAEKLAKAFGGKQSQAGPKPQMAAPLKAAGSISLTNALANNGCLDSINAQGPNPQVPSALFIGGTLPIKGGNSACTSVTISATDTTPFTAASPLIPIVVGSGGTLYLQDQPMTLYASSFLIWNGGTMQAGNPGARVQNQITIVMAGNSSAALPPTTGDQNPNMRDITVMDGGTLALYGAKGLSGNPDNLNNNPSKSPAFINTLYGTKSWTYLAVPAGPSSLYGENGTIGNVSAPVPTQTPDGTLLTLANLVDWQVGDWISVATTSFSSHQTEIVQICAIAPVPDPETSLPGVPAQVSQITLRNGMNCTATPNNTPLKHYHYGGLAPTPGFFPAGTQQVVAKGGKAIDVSRQAKSFYDDHHRNYGIDERAEVALLSRNIKLTSVAGQSSDTNNFIGGHLAAMVSSATAAPPTLQLVGVEIEKFGQGLVGRYPVHLHKLPQYPVTGAANAADGNIAITSSTVPANGTLVTISGVQGNTAANVRSGLVTNANTGAGTFEILGQTSNGTYTSGGIWTPATILVQDVSVHHSYNKCYVVHGTGNANFYNNVCVRTVGQGFYLEDGTNITGNQFMRNHIAGTMAANTTYSYPQKNKSQYWDGDNLQQQHTPPPTSITNATNASPICLSSSSLPTIGTQITITGVGGNSAANGTWTAASDPSCPSGSSVALQSSGNGAYATNTGMWQQQTGPKPWNKTSGGVSNATNGSPIVITSGSTNVPQQYGPGVNPVTVQMVQGNTAANGTWAATNVNTTNNTFTLQSLGNGTYTSGGTWAEPPNWYNVNNVPDTSLSGANAGQPYGPDLANPGGFWITNLGNTFVNNSVAGCQAQGRGYWLLSQDPTQIYAYPEFTGNRVHGCYNGIDTDHDIMSNGGQARPTLQNSATAQAPVLVLNDNTVTRSRQRGIWIRAIYTALHNNRLATNLFGFSLLGGGGPEGNEPGYWGLAHDNVIAGMTRNNVERYPGCTQGNNAWEQECTDVTLNVNSAGWGKYPAYNINVQGYSYYDGPARIEHNRFINFRFDPTGSHSDPAARLITATDLTKMQTPTLKQGQLTNPTGVTPVPNAASAASYQGYPGDPATGWLPSNAQTVPPTQYIRDSLWENVDFKHQIYTEEVNEGSFSDGDKSTVIRDLDGQLSGLRVTLNGHIHQPAPDVVPISLNNLDYFATDFTVDEPHSRGPNNFRASSLMSPHKYATLNIESAVNPQSGFNVVAQRDMPAYDGTTYPSLYLYGRGGFPIYEPFVMDRIGYTVYGVTGGEQRTLTNAPFMNQLLFSYTDPPVKKVGDFFVTRIAVYQPATSANIRVSRIRRQWGQAYLSGIFPPNYSPPGGAANTCDGVFNQSQGGNQQQRWQDCLARANNAVPPYPWQGGPAQYSGGKTISAATGATPAAQWTNFEAPYKTLMGIANPQPSDIANFINAQTFYYDTANNLLYFYMIEDQPVQQQPSPYGTCGGGATQYAANVATTQTIKSFSHLNSVQRALNASCLVSGGTWTWGSSSASYPITNVVNATASGINAVVVTSPNSPPTGTQVTIASVQGFTGINTTWTVTNIDATHFSLNSSSSITSGTFTGAVPQPIDLFTCGANGCAAYLVDLAALPITGASNAKPITITTSATVPANLTQVVISGVQGNTAANGAWAVTNVNTSAGTFQLQNSDGTKSGAYTSGGTWDNLQSTGSTPTPCFPNCVPLHPIPTATYNSWNQYQFVYSTTTQQPNGVSVAANQAIGNTAPPTDGTALTGTMTPTDGTPPPAGDQVTYNFQSYSGVVNNVTENFRYHCVQLPPWSPVNARGTYPPGGGPTFPLTDSVCTMPYPVTGATVSTGGLITITTSASAPATGVQVTISGVQGITNANGQWTVANTGPNTFSLNGSNGSGTYTSGGTWQAQ